MLAVHIEGGRVRVRDIPVPARPAGFALIRMLCAGICNTDLELQRGYYGFAGTPGHEFVGEVVESDDPAWRGKRVVGEINLACGRCEWCARSLGRHCPNRTVLGIVKHPGAFAEYLTLPERNLHVAPESVSTERATFAEPVAAACEILEQVSIPGDEPVAVLGRGKLGLLIEQVLRASGKRVDPYGRADRKPPRSYQWVVEATGSADGLREALAMTRPRGCIILKSTVHGDVPLDTAAAVVHEITLVGSRCGQFPPALDLLAQGAVDVETMIHARYRLSEAPAAFEHAGRKGALKVLLTP
ncbi:MAG: alcohol dehydrogenase catalytic domain-containing protein [Bryobacteraceae bacterium]